MKRFSAHNPDKGEIMLHRTIFVKLGNQRKLTQALALAAMATVGSIQSAKGVVTSWIGGVTGNWTLNTNWSGSVTPNTSAFDVFIDGGNVQNTTVTLDANETIGALTISAGDRLNIGNNLQLAVNGTSISNAGTITIAAIANSATLRIDTNPVSLTGGGTIILSQTGAGGGAFLIGSTALTNVNNTIRGQGAIGSNGNSFINQGTVNADVIGAAITIDTNNAANTLNNSGTLTASNGGILQLSGNAGGSGLNTGTILAQTGSQVRLINGMSMSGGTLATSGTGTISVLSGHTGNLDSFTNLGNITLENNSQLNVNGGTITNSGSINVSAAANTTALSISGTQSMLGSGTINLSTTGAGGNAFITGSGTWTTSNTIQGAGFLGSNALSITTSGLVQATTGTLVIDPRNAANSYINDGTLLANGGALQLTGNAGGSFLNNGRIISGSSDVQLVANANITGGTLASTGAGAIRVLSGHTANISSLTNTGKVTLENNSQLDLSGTIVNTGSFNVEAIANTTAMNLNTGTLSGGGTVNLSMTGAGGTAYVTGSGTLTNVNNLIRGQGAVGSNAMAVINQASGTIRADVTGGGITLDPSNTGTQAFRNQGQLVASNGGILVFTGNAGGGFDNTGGGIQAQTASEVRLVTNASLIGGTLSTTGTGSINVADGQTASMNGLAISGNAQVSNNAQLNYSNALALTGSLTLAAGANNAQFTVNSSAVAISGSGSIVMTQTGTGGAARMDGTGTLTLDVPVSGGGQIGLNSLSVFTNSTVNASAIGQSILFDPANTKAVVNAGTLLASTGNIILTGNGGGTFENAGGRIISGAGDVQLVTSAYVNGGTFSSTGLGAIRVPSGNLGQLNSFTNTGNIIVETNSDLNLTGTITNNGSISLNPIANNARINLNGGTVTLNGTGTVFLNTGTAGGQAQIAGGSALVNNQTIRGGGLIGTNSMFVTNNGTIINDNPLAGLTLDPVNAASAFTNNGTINSSVSVIAFTGNGGGDFNNTAGRIISGAADIQLHTSASIFGGTLSSTGAGVIRALDGATVYLSSLANSGAIVVNNNADLYLAGTINNTGSISLNAVANTTRILVNGSLTLAGSGTVNMNQTGAGQPQIVNSGTFTNNNYIHGAGAIGGNSSFVVNNATIVADNPSAVILLDPVNVSGGFTNNGTLLASTGAMQFTGNAGGDFNNTAGRIISGAADIQLHTSASIFGGTLSSTGAGVIRALDGHTVYLSSLANTGAIVVNNNADLYFAGTINNTGSISLNAVANNTRILANGSFTLTGSGTVNMNQTGAGQPQIVNTGTLTNNGNFIRGAGAIGGNSLRVINNAVIQADLPATSIVFDAPNAAGGITNNGLLRATSGGQLYFTGNAGGTFAGTGSLDVQASSYLTLDNSANLTNGQVINNGTVTVQNSSFASLASLAGNGTIIINNSSRIDIRPNGTQAATSKAISLTITSPAKLDLNDNAMVVDYTGASPYSTIRSQILSGYNNGNWNGNGIISTSSLGDLTKSLGYAEASATPFTTTFRGQSFAGGNAVLMMHTYRGDVNLDRTVSSLDFNALALGYGIKDGSATWSQGDFDYNGKVNTIDFNWLAGNFGQTLPAASDLPAPTLGAVVPEPTSVVTSLAMLLTGLKLRRHRR
jgi:hypothetical protein